MAACFILVGGIPASSWPFPHIVGRTIISLKTPIFRVQYTFEGYQHCLDECGNVEKSCTEVCRTVEVATRRSIEAQKNSGEVSKTDATIAGGIAKQELWECQIACKESQNSCRKDCE